MKVYKINSSMWHGKLFMSKERAIEEIEMEFKDDVAYFKIQEKKGETSVKCCDEFDTVLKLLYIHEVEVIE